MLGAILGDMVGSPFEFDHNNYKHKDFPLLSEKSHFTDDTVMTVAVAQGLMAGQGNAPKTFAEVQHEMRRWGRAYPDAGYGGMFRRWLHAENPKPYGSFGNGSAMRVSAAGWLFDTLDEKSGAEKKTSTTVLVQASDLRDAVKKLDEGMKGTMADYVIASVAETAIMDVYPYEAEPDVKPEFPDAGKTE